jgi:uncharacterized protein (TIGR03435 family)
VKLASAIRRSSLGATLLVLVAVMPLVLAQAPATTPQTSVKPLAFDIVSIRPAKPGTFPTYNWLKTPDGYHVTGLSLFATLMFAYFPQNSWGWSEERLSGAPAWADDLYEINARVSDADLADWQKQGISLEREPMLQQMLRSMLTDRFHLVAHMVAGPPIPGFSLELDKHGPRFAESKPGAVLPDGIRLPDGGIQRSYGPGQNPHYSLFGASMADVAQALSNRAQRPVLDHTGLTGRYDLVLNWVEGLNSTDVRGKIAEDDPYPLSHWGIEALGLRAIPISIPAQTLVIDHIEKPSDN